MLNKIIKNKKQGLIMLLLIVFFTFGFMHAGHAGLAEETVAQAIGGIGALVIKVCGWILGAVINGILLIAGYNDFINEPAIKDAWVVIRDFCNMLFILVLLVIAFASILRIENYSIKRWLPKVILMAVLINFSRTICGLLIDASQIVMLTFVNTFADSGANFIEHLQVRQYLEIAKDSVETWKGNSVNLSNVVAGMLAAIVFLIIATVAMMAVLIMFLMRLIMLWIYVAISPLAFLMMSFPQGQKYASQFWGDFTKYLINGPVLAFFIWLALSTVQSVDSISGEIFTSNEEAGAFLEILTSSGFIQFIMAIGFLAGGLMTASQIGGMGASWGSRTVSNLQNRGMAWGKKQTVGRALSTAKWGKDKSVAGLKVAGSAAGRYGLGLAKGLDQRAGTAAGLEGGLISTGVSKTKKALSLDFVKTGNQNRFEADKSRHDYSVAKDNFIKTELANKKAEIASVKNLSGKTLDDEFNKNKDRWERIANRKWRSENKFMSYQGSKWKEDKEGSFYRVDEDGSAINEKGEKITNAADRHYAGFKDEIGRNQRLTSMNQKQRDMFKGRFDARSSAFAAARMATEAKMDDEIKKIKASGITDTMLENSLKDTSLSAEQRQARALHLANGDHFKGKSVEEINKIKEVFGSNNLLTKRFNDALQKQLPHLIHDLSTETGKQAFKKAYNQGKIDDIVHLDALEDNNFIETMRDLKGDKEFGEWAKKFSKKSSKHKEELVKTISNQISSAKVEGDKKGSLHPLRKAMHNLTDDIHAAMQGVSDSAELRKGTKMIWKSMNTKQKANLELDNFDSKKTSAEFVSNLESVIKEDITDKALESIRRHADTSNDLYEKYEKIKNS